MTKRTFSNTHPRREAAEKDGIALMLSGSYVLTSLDQDEFDLLRRTAPNTLSFPDEPTVVVTNAKSKSKRGKLARIAHLSADGRFVRYRNPIFASRTSIATLQLIGGIAYTPANFLAHIANNETLHVRRQHDRKEFTGILYGSDQHAYSSLLIPADTAPGFAFLDIETEPNPHNARALVSVLARNPLSPAQFILSISTSNASTRNG
ncbi:MAG: hypothetical protein ABIP85_22215 [Chthoniobacteraceae bacterium]